jgi:hypothetical protein
MICIEVDDFRPEVHDSDGMAIYNGRGAMGALSTGVIRTMICRVNAEIRLSQFRLH